MTDDEPQPRVPTRRLAHHWPFRESVVDGVLVRNLPPQTKQERTKERVAEEPRIFHRKRWN